MEKLLTYIIETIKGLYPDQNVVIGSLPTNNSMSIILTGGSLETFFKKGSTYEDLDLLLNGKDDDQEKIATRLKEVHRMFTITEEYFHDTEIQITDISTQSLPTLLDRDGEQWLYGSSLSVRIYNRRTS